jgi:hypothetical protein
MVIAINQNNVKHFDIGFVGMVEENEFPANRYYIVA